MKRTALAGLAIALWCGAQAEGKLTGVQSHKVGQGVEIQVQGQDLAAPKILRLNNNRSYVLEFNADLVGGRKHVKVDAGGVQYVTAGWYSSRPPIVRVHLWLQPNQKPELTQNGEGWLVCVNTPVPTAKGTGSAFPDKVPPLKSAAAGPPASTAKAPQTKRYASAGHDVSQKIVSVNGHATEIVLILRGLALQSGANIITGPEVTGKITVELKGVTLIEALDYVTTLARVRYAKVGKTYIVTSNARFAEAMRQIANKLEENGETRVVQLVSGEGVQLKASTMKALPQFTAMGSYDIILPTEDIRASSFSGSGVGQSESGTAGSKSEATTEDTGGIGGGTSGSAGGAGSTGGGDGKAGGATDKSKDTGTAGSEGKTLQASANIGGVNLSADSKERAKTGVKDAYLVVVGSPERVEEVVSFIKQLDNQVAVAANVGPNRDIDTKVIPIYSAQVPKIRTALQSLVDRDARKAAFQIADSRIQKSADNSELPENATGDIDLLFVTGPRESLENLVQFAKSLDEGICEASGIPYATTPEESKRSYAVVDLKHVEPLEAADELNKKIRGIRASMMPSPVDPIVLGESDPRIDGTKQPPKGTRTVSTTDTTIKEEAAAKAGGQGTGTTSGEGGGGSATSAGSGTASLSGVATGTGAGSGTKMSKTLGTEPMRLLLYGTKAQIAAAQELLNVIDLAPKQVAMELRVMELSHEEAQKIGLDWSILTGGTLKTFRMNQSVGGAAGTAGNISSDLRMKDGDTASILGTLDSISGGNKLIARPNILANDGRPSEMFIGDKIAYIESIQSSQNGITVTTKTIDVGVTFLVTPRVGGDDMLTLDLRPSLIYLKGFTAVPGGGQLPQVSERMTRTITSLRSGETLAIGGLIQDQDKKTFSGIPFLKDIPIIGRLFSRTDNSKTRTEVVFFLTAKVVDNTNKADAAHPKTHDDDVMPTPKAPAK